MCSSDRRQPGSNAAVAASPLAGTLSALAMPPSGASYCSCAHSIHSRCVLRSARSSSMDWQTSWRHTFHNTGRNTGVSGGACQGSDGCTCDSCATTTVKGVWQRRPFSPHPHPHPGWTTGQSCSVLFMGHAWWEGVQARRVLATPSVLHLVKGLVSL